MFMTSFICASFSFLIWLIVERLVVRVEALVLLTLFELFECFFIEMVAIELFCTNLLGNLDLLSLLLASYF